MLLFLIGSLVVASEGILLSEDLMPLTNRSSVCYGPGTHGMFYPTCPGNNTVIAIQRLMVGAKPKTDNCPQSVMKYNESNVIVDSHNRSHVLDFMKCCFPDTDLSDSEQCAYEYDYYNTSDAEYHRVCSGYTECKKDMEVSWAPRHPTCSDEHMDNSNYMYMEYSCIDRARIEDLCSNITKTSTSGRPLYLQNNNYPEGVSARFSTCHCDVSFSANTLIVTTVDVRLNEQQTLKISGETDIVFDSDNEPGFNGTKYQQMNNFSILLTNGRSSDGGYIWIGLESDKTAYEIHITCTSKLKEAPTTMLPNDTTPPSKLSTLTTTNNPGSSSTPDVPTNSSSSSATNTPTNDGNSSSTDAPTIPPSSPTTNTSPMSPSPSDTNASTNTGSSSAADPPTPTSPKSPNSPATSAPPYTPNPSSTNAPTNTPCSWTQPPKIIIIVIVTVIVIVIVVIVVCCVCNGWNPCKHCDCCVGDTSEAGGSVSGSGSGTGPESSCGNSCGTSCGSSIGTCCGCASGSGTSTWCASCVCSCGGQSGLCCRCTGLGGKRHPCCFWYYCCSWLSFCKNTRVHPDEDDHETEIRKSFPIFNDEDETIISRGPLETTLTTDVVITFEASKKKQVPNVMITPNKPPVSLPPILGVCETNSHDNTNVDISVDLDMKTKKKKKHKKHKKHRKSEKEQYNHDVIDNTDGAYYNGKANINLENERREKKQKNKHRDQDQENNEEAILSNTEELRMDLGSGMKENDVEVDGKADIKLENERRLKKKKKQHRDQGQENNEEAILSNTDELRMDFGSGMKDNDVDVDGKANIKLENERREKKKKKKHRDQGQDNNKEAILSNTDELRMDLSSGIKDNDVDVESHSYASERIDIEINTKQRKKKKRTHRKKQTTENQEDAEHSHSAIIAVVVRNTEDIVHSTDDEFNASISYETENIHQSFA